jgi:hypothetical protein
MWLCTNLEPVANGQRTFYNLNVVFLCRQRRNDRSFDTSNYEMMPVALLRPVFHIPYVAMNFMAALAIRVLIANICTRWRLIIKRLSQDQGRTDLKKKNIRGSPLKTAYLDLAGQYR